jgi:hypothetical protein
MNLNEMGDRVLFTVSIIDVADTARRMFGGDEAASYIIGHLLSEHDYRFHVDYEDGGVVTFGNGAIAAEVAAALIERSER